MSGAIGVGAFVLALIVMIMVHESGHFLAARRFGIKVEEFFLGFGPKLFSRRWGETEYGVKAILLGGYVRIAGMNPAQTIPESDLPRTYGAKPAWQRAILLSAGSASHLVLAGFILLVTFAAIGFPVAQTQLAEVNESFQGSPGPAKAAGLEPGDRIVMAEGRRITDWEQFRRLIRTSSGEAIDVEVERDGRRLGLTATPTAIEDPPGSGRSVGFLGVTPKTRNVRQPAHQAVWSAVTVTGGLVQASLVGIVQIFSPDGIRSVFASLGDKGSREMTDPIGLVGAGRVAAQITESGRFQTLLAFFAGFIVFVGVFNMMPLPPLDGGHLVVLAIEKITGRSIDTRKVVPIAVAVLAFLVVYLLVLLYLDIVRPVPNPF